MNISSGVQLLTLAEKKNNFKLAMRVIQIKLQGMHVYLQALNEITAWKKKSRHV